MKNKKIIAFVCAISMIFSMLASFTVVNAEATKGIALEIVQTSKTVAKVTAQYVGLDDGINGANVVISFPVGATVTYTKPDTEHVTYTENREKEAEGIIGLSLAMLDDIKLTDKLLTEFTITLPSEMSSNAEIALQAGSYVSQMATETMLTLDDDTLAAESVTMKADPNAEEIEPIAKDSDYNKDNVTIPETKTPVEVPATGGIDLEYSKVSNTVAKVTAKYVGFEDGINGANVVINFPVGATVTYTKPDTEHVTYTENREKEAEGIIGLSLALLDDIKLTDNLLTEFTITYPTDGVAEDFICELQSGSYISQMATEKMLTLEEGLVGDWVTLPASVEDKRETVALNDKIPSSEVKDAVDAAEDAYLAIEVTNDDGSDPTYGEDYTAYYNGAEINEDTLKALLAGEVEGVSLEDAAKGLTFKYNSGTKIKFQLVADGEVAKEEETEDGGDDTKPTPSPTPTPAPVMTIETTVGGKAATQVTEKSILTVNVTVPEKLKAEGATIDALELNPTGLLELVSSKVADDGLTAEYKYQAVKVGTVKITANYVKEVAAEAELQAEATTTTKETVATASTSIKIVAEKGSTTTSSDSSSKSSGGGAIATGLVDTGAGTVPFGFTDLGDAAWSSEAVNALAARKIVSGVGDNKFDPNGALTRAAYAQMLVNAIGKQTEDADVEFDDVATSDWFYHNVAVAAKYGIVSGYGDGNFGPYDLITREQMALMTLKAAEVMSVSLVGADAGAFSDDADIADWSRDAVYTLANAGIINGMGDGTFAPKANATRAQAAVIIYNTFVK